MSRRAVLLLVVLACGAARVHAAGFPLWAYGYIRLPASPGDYSATCLGGRPLDCDRPGGLPSDPGNTIRRLPGSDLAFTIAQINFRYGPADWFPGDHPVMPDIVAHGKEAIGLRACALCQGSLARGAALSRGCRTCHGADLRGVKNVPPIAGRSPSYIGRQLYDFQQGARNTDLAKVMRPVVETLTDDDLIAISAYVASRQP